ncbi:hypothetical protein ACFQ0B_50480 [Nonomuraea thailandensis]
MTGQVARSSGGPDDPAVDELVRRKALANGLPAAMIGRCGGWRSCLR